MTTPAIAILPASSTLPPAGLTAAGALESDRTAVQAGRDDFISGRPGRGRLQLAVARLRAERFRERLPKPTAADQRWTFFSANQPSVTSTGSLVGEIVVATGQPPIASEHQEVAELARILAGAMEILAEAADSARQKAAGTGAITHLLTILSRIEKLTLNPDSRAIFERAFFESTWAQRNVPQRFEEATFRQGVLNFTTTLILLNALKQIDSPFASNAYFLLATPSLRTFFVNVADILVFYNKVTDAALRLNTREALEKTAQLEKSVEAIEEMLKLAQQLVPAELTLFWVQAMGERFGSQPTLKVIRGLRRKIHVAKIRLNQ